MSYFDGLINSWFKRAEDGRRIFYPYGIFARGYVLSSDNEARLKRFLKHFYMVSLPTVIVSAIVLKLYAFVLLLFLIPIYLIKMGRILGTAERTKEKVSLREITKNMAAGMGVPTSVSLFIGSLLMMGASVVCIFLPNARLIGIFGTIFSGLCLLQSIFLVRYSICLTKGKGYSKSSAPQPK